MTIDDVKNVCFVGAGTMGCYNSIVAAISGYQVTIYDIDAATLEQVPARHREFAEFLVANAYCTQQDIPGALGRISIVRELEPAVADADLVSESVFERLDIKRDIHRRLDAVCPPGTIITTNSSALPVSAIEDVVKGGDRFAALHSHLGAPLVDIVGGPRTSVATIETLKRYVLSIGGVPLLLKKEHPGYVLNAMLGPLLSTGMLLVSEGEAGVEQVDRAWMRYRNAPMGPFAMMDLFGLNLVYDSWRYRQENPATDGLRAAVLELLQPFIEREELGMKSGRGFYQYPHPAYQRDGFLDDGGDLAEAYAALMTAWVGNAVALAAMDVAEADDIDMAWTVGTYLDTGPFEVLAQVGAEEFLRMLGQQVAAGRFEAAKAGMVESYLSGTSAAESRA